MTDRLHRVVLAVILGALVLVAAPLAGADDWSDARKVFRRTLKSDVWQTRREAYMALLDFDGEQAVTEILKAMAREKNPAVLMSAIETLGQFLSDEAGAALQEAVRSAKGEMRLYLIIAFGLRLAGDDAGVLGELSGNKDPMVAAQAVLSLGRRRFKEVLPVFVDMLQREEWQLRAAGARAIKDLAGPIPDPPLPNQKPKPWIPEWLDPDDVLMPLAVSLERSEGRERGDIIAALERISKQAFGNDAPAWKQYAEGVETDKIRKRPKRPPHIFGMPIYGRRVVAIIDTSVCTDDPHPYEQLDRLKELCEVPGARTVPWYELRTTGQFMVAHTIRLVRDLPKGTKFDVIVVGLGVRPVFGKLTAINTGTQKKAISELESLKIENGMDAYGALTQALDVSGRKDSVAWSLGPDEIIYQCCSVPWAAEVLDQDVVAAAVALKSRLRLVAIHTVGVGNHPYKMMRPMSESSGGRYLDLSR